MPERAYDVVRTSEPSEWELTRRVDELRALVDELRAQRDALVQRARVHELEIDAQRRELELRFAFEATLDEQLLEYRQQVESLHAHVETEVQRRFAVELEVERQLAAEARRDRDDIRRVLDAERRRISYRAAQRVVVPMTRGRVFVAELRRSARARRAGSRGPFG